MPTESQQAVMLEPPQGDNVAQLPVAKPPRIAVTASDFDDPAALYLNTAVFEQLQRVATLMAHSALVPKHLSGPDKVSDCFLVAAQAMRWRMDPFSVSQHTFVTQGKLGYEGKLIAAVINSSGKLSRTLDYAYDGAGDGRTVTVAGTLKGEAEPRKVSGNIGGWRTQNEKWKSMPDQMLAYRGAREWARRHMPEAVLGVQADDDLDGIPNFREGRDGIYAPAESVPMVRPTRSGTAQAPVDVAPAMVVQEPAPVLISSPSKEAEKINTPPAKPDAAFIPYPKNKAAKQHADDLIKGMRECSDRPSFDAFCDANVQSIELLKSRDPDQANRVAEEIDIKLDGFQIAMQV